MLDDDYLMDQCAIPSATLTDRCAFKFKFNTRPGTLSVAEVNERFSFSYGFRGDYQVHLR